MTKEIIIDGVNVAECEQIFAQRKCALLDQVYCEDNPDCYYKQLKRLEFELKVTKADYEASEQENKELVHYLACMTEQRNKANTTLQEIKDIAEDAYENDNKYQATGVYNEIIQKITKAEKE